MKRPQAYLPMHLLLVIHNHQPLGNLPEVFRKAYNEAYAPFLDVVRAHPGIKWALHVSGCLWEWLEAEESGYVETLAEEHAAGRLEFITGGLWEPIQPLLDERACLLHFKGMREYLRQRFGVEPVGSWTTERVWEPALASRLANAGVRYTFVDDSQLRAGLPPPSEHQVWGYYRTEHDGRSVAIFPIDEGLRYLIPFHKADEVIAHLEDRARALPQNACVTYADDGEKFGLWPNTHDWVYGEGGKGKAGWLDEFLGLIEESKLVHTIHPADYIERVMPHPRQRVYVPTSSYREMGIWNLFPGRNLAAERVHKWVESDAELREVGPPHVSGLFRTFLARYPESRYMHERVAELLERILERDPDPCALPLAPEDFTSAPVPFSEPDLSPLSRALWHALRAQCNCAYWHGVFGGLYLNYLRFAVHREILAAEAALASLDNPPPRMRYLGTRYGGAGRGDLRPEPESSVLVGAERVHWVVDPMSGQIVSAGFLERRVDVIDVLARRFEAYHATMREAGEEGGADGTPASIHDIVEVAPPGWREGHGYDPCRRGCFADRLVETPLKIDQLARVEYTPLLGPGSRSFMAGHCCWKAQVKPISGEEGEGVELSRSDGPWRRVKTLAFKDHGTVCEASFELSREDGRGFEGFLLWEFNFGLLAGEAPDRYHVLPNGRRMPLAARFELDRVDETACVDEWTGVRVDLSVPGAEWVGAYPVKTLSRGECGLELNYQGTGIVFRVPFRLAEGSTWISEARMKVAPTT